MFERLRNLFGKSEPEEEISTASPAVAPTASPAAIPPEAQALERASWKPQTSTERAQPGDSKFGGVALIGPNEKWPRCGSCERPMQLFLQLRSTDLPQGAAGLFQGVLQLFYCTSSEPACDIDLEAWAPFSAATCCRTVPLDLQPAVDRSPVEGGFEERKIVGWVQQVDYPGWEDVNASGLGISDEVGDVPAELGYPLVGDKLLGWPAWVQGAEYPQCPDCGQRMRFLFQVDSEDNLPFMFGDMGRGHVCQCREHPAQLAFGWACY